MLVTFDHYCTGEDDGLIMDDIRNVVFLRIRDVTKQNGHACEGTLYREPLGEIVVHYDDIYKIEKGPR